jgi:hypothetical protein
MCLDLYILLLKEYVYPEKDESTQANQSHDNQNRIGNKQITSCEPAWESFNVI